MQENDTDEQGLETMEIEKNARSERMVGKVAKACDLTPACTRVTERQSTAPQMRQNKFHLFPKTLEQH